MMAELEYSGITKPQERARRDAKVLAVAKALGEDAAAHINAQFARVEIAELSPFMRAVAEDYFRPCGPPLTECYRRGLRIAAKHEFATVSLSTARRVIRSMVSALGADQYRKPGTKGLQLSGPSSWVLDHTPNAKQLAIAKALGEEAAERIKRRLKSDPKPFLAAAELEAMISARRHRHVECAKEILEIYRQVQLHGFVGEGDHSFEATAERLASLIFGGRSNGGH